MQKNCKNCGNEFAARYKFAAYCADCKMLGHGGGSHKKKKVAASTTEDKHIVEDMLGEGLDENYANIQVADPEEKAAQNIAQRILNGIGINTNAPVADSSRAKRRRKEKFFRSVVPLVSNLSVLMVRSSLHGDYKDCAPLENELIAVLSPMANMVDRRIDISAAMSPDIEDLLVCIKAVGIMTIRVWDTKNQIDEQINDRDSKREQHTGQQSFTNAHTGSMERGMPGTTQQQDTANGAIIVDEYSGLYAGQNGHRPEDARVNPATGKLATLDGHDANNIIAQALARDFAYRQSNGML